MRTTFSRAAQWIRSLAAKSAVTSAVTLSISCQMAMPIPPDVARDMAPIPITNRGSFTGSWANESFTMASYQVSDVARAGRTSAGISAQAAPDVNASGTRSNSGYSYTFLAAGGPARGECTTQLSEGQAQAGYYSAQGNDSHVACRCTQGGLDTQVVLEGPDGAWQGTVMLHGYPVQIRAIEQYANGMHAPQPLGYDVRAQIALGAVEVKHPGRVWFSPTLDPQSNAELGCLFAGLLLFETPKQGL
jgi:hypothetical protein